MLRQHQASLDDRKKFTALVRDLFPDQAKNVNLLLMAYNMGIAQDIQSASYINNTFAFRYVKQLMDDFGMSRVNADWIISVWCFCYGGKVLGKACDISVQKQGSGPAIQGEQSSSGKVYGDLFEYKRSQRGNGLAVTGFRGSQNQTIIFQNRSGNTPVVEVADDSFCNSSTEEAILTEGIASIGRNAFSGCDKLHQVVLPISIEEINDSAFENCRNLKSVSLPGALKTIGNAAFKGTGLRTIAIPESVFWIGNGVVADCQLLEHVTIPSNMDKIPEHMFEGCINLKKVELHERLNEIGERAFFGCSSLDFIVIPDSVKKIGKNAFTNTDKQFIMQCSFGSYAEEYARKNKFKYQLVQPRIQIVACYATTKEKIHGILTEQRGERMGLFDILFGNQNQIPTVTTILPDVARQEIIAGRLPILNTDKLFLKRGEKIHFIDKAINMEKKTVKEFRHVGGSAPGLFEGTRVSSGKGKTVEHTELIQHRGILYITNQRIVFQATEWGFDKTYRYLTAITPYSNACEMQFGNKSYCMVVPDGSVVNQVLQLIKQRRQVP